MAPTSQKNHFLYFSSQDYIKYHRNEAVALTQLSAAQQTHKLRQEKFK